MKNPNIEIPHPVPMTGWKELPIEECKEPLVLLNSFAPRFLEVRSGYALQGIRGASFDQYARSGVAERLVQAAQTLQTFRPDAKLLVIDAYRPKEVQQALFDDFKAKLATENPDWDPDTLSGNTQKYVSIPSTDLLKPSPHITGGAIDLTIIENEKPLNFGTEWDDFTTRAGTAFFEGSTDPSELEFKKNRRLLYHSMTQAGFSGYPEEWWHFDYGNQFWSQVSGQRPAIYSVIYPEGNSL